MNSSVPIKLFIRKCWRVICLFVLLNSMLLKISVEMIYIYYFIKHGVYNYLKVQGGICILLQISKVYLLLTWILFKRLLYIQCYSEIAQLEQLIQKKSLDAAHILVQNHEPPSFLKRNSKLKLVRDQFIIMNLEDTLQHETREITFINNK